MLILDEILELLDYHIIKVEDIIGLIEKKPDYIEMILTGRNLPKELEDYADYYPELRSLRIKVNKVWSTAAPGYPGADFDIGLNVAYHFRAFVV